MKPGILRIVIADGGHARFVSVTGDGTLCTETALEAPGLHRQTADIVSDRPGRSFESAMPARHTLASKHDPHELEKLRFARFVAGRISHDAREAHVDRLILVAPAPILAELRARLGSIVRKLVIGTLAKDLVKVPDHELQPHLEQWV